MPPPAWVHDHEDVLTLRRLAAEFLGTFVLVFIHAGLALSVSNTASEEQPGNRTTLIAVGVGDGASLTGLIYALGHISGAHFNPAVSLAFVLKGAFSLSGLLLYWATQIGAAFAAAGVLDAFFTGDKQHGSLGANYPRGGFGISAAFWLEYIVSLILYMVILGTASRGKVVGPHAALAVGATIGFVVLMGHPYGGSSMNPARSLAPGVLTSNADARDSVWIYVVAPLCAALTMGPLMRWLSPTQGKGRREEEQAAGGEAGPMLQEGRASQQQQLQHSGGAGGGPSQQP